MSVVPHVEQQIRLLDRGGTPVSSCLDSVPERECRRMSVVPHVEQQLRLSWIGVAHRCRVACIRCARQERVKHTEPQIPAKHYNVWILYAIFLTRGPR